MTKIAILGDLHVGARNSNQIIQLWQERFFNEVFWPYMEDSGIKRIIQLGDVYDNRRWLNMSSVDWFERVFIRKLVENGVHMDALVGNHDTYFKNSIHPNSPNSLLGHKDNVTVWNDPGVLQIDDKRFNMVPWICNSNQDECMSMLNEGGDIVIGHFEIMNFEMHPGAINHTGLSQSTFKNWNRVWSGHFHTQSEMGNIHYLGTPFQMSWSDYLPKFGFWVYDTNDDTLEYVENKLRYFHRYVWEDGTTKSLENLKNSYVKVIIKKKTDFEKFERFIDSINLQDPCDLKIVESFEQWNNENVEELITVSTTEEMIEEYINDVTTHSDKNKIKQMMRSIYTDAQNLDEI